jgi:hypothetical protein
MGGNACTLNELCKILEERGKDKMKSNMKKTAKFMQLTKDKKQTRHVLQTDRGGHNRACRLVGDENLVFEVGASLLHLSQVFDSKYFPVAQPSNTFACSMPVTVEKKMGKPKNSEKKKINAQRSVWKIGWELAMNSELTTQ